MRKKWHFFQLPPGVTTNQEEYQANTEIERLQDIAGNRETLLFFREIFERLSWGWCSHESCDILKEMHKISY